MHIAKSNTFKIVLLALLIALSLVFNQNGNLWISIENKYFQLFYLLLFSALLFLVSKIQIKLNKVDVIIILLLLLSTVTRVLHLGDLNEIEVITTLALIVYYLALKTIDLTYADKQNYDTLIIIVGLMLSMYCILEYYYILMPTSINWRMTGNFTNPGPLGGFLSILLPLGILKLLNTTIRKNKIKTACYIFISIAIAFVIVLSASRAAMLSVVFVLVMLFCIYGVKKWSYFKHVLWSLVPIVSVIVFSKGVNSISGRLLIWKISILSFWDNRLVGVGYNFFRVNYPNFQADYFSQGGTEKEILLAGANKLAFNEFLKFIIENGLLGIMLLSIGIIWLVYKKEERKIMALKHVSMESLVIFCSFLFFAFFSYPLLFLPFKLVLINQIALRNSKSSTLYGIKLNKISLKVLGCFFVCSFLLIGIYQYKGLCAWKRGAELAFKSPNATEKYYKYALQRLRNNGLFLFYYGNFVEDRDINNALKFYEKAKTQYNSPLLYLKLALLNEKLGNIKETERNLLKRHFMNPHLFKPLEDLLDFYIRQDNAINVKLYINKIIHLPIKVENKVVLRIKQKAKNLEARMGGKFF